MKEMVERLPSVMIERPKMPRSTWEALKAHINRERIKKKQALEQTQEFERQKKEREQRKQQEALTLEETKGQIAKLESQLHEHKEGKHQLFQELKKVIYQEQDLTKRTIKEASNSHPHLYLQPSRPGGGGHGSGGHSFYPRPQPHFLMSAADSMREQSSTSRGASATPTSQGNKRPLSPSPVSSAAHYRQPSSTDGSSLSVPGVPAPKYILFSTTKDGGSHLLTTTSYSVASSTSTVSTAPARPGPTIRNYPPVSQNGPMHGQVNRQTEDERAKQKQAYQSNQSPSIMSWSNSSAAHSNHPYAIEGQNQNHPQPSGGQNQQQQASTQNQQTAGKSQQSSSSTTSMNDDERMKLQKQQQAYIANANASAANVAAIARTYGHDSPQSASQDDEQRKKFQQQQMFYANATVAAANAAAIARSLAHERASQMHQQQAAASMDSERYKQAFLNSAAAASGSSSASSLHSMGQQRASVLDDERYKQLQQHYYQAANMNPEARILAHQHQQVLAHMQQAAVAVLAQQHLPTAANSGFRPGSLMSGYPRYPGNSTGSMTSSTSGSQQRAPHPGSGQGSDRYYPK